MVDVKELRVGAHINIGGVRHCVSNIGYLNGQIGIGASVMGSDGVKHAVGYSTADIEPIPITAALLAEIGFEPVRKALGRADEEWRMELDGYPIRLMKGYSDNPEREWSVHIDSWDYDTIGSTDVAYLHQLESFIYLCTGKELINHTEL